MDHLIAGIQNYKPNHILNNKELEELLRDARREDEDVTVDQSGLARVIVKKQIDQRMCEKRVDELRRNIR